MYNTTSQFITSARALKGLLLIAMITDKSIHIETGSAGSVPCVLDKPNKIILNRNFAHQMVPADDTSASQPRYLDRELLGKKIGIVTNYDDLPAQPEAPFGQSVLLDIRSDSVPPLPYGFRERACISLSTSLPPDAVVELINFLTEGPEFSDEAIFKLKAYAGTAARLGNRFRQEIGDFVHSLKEGTEPQGKRVKAGFATSFGDGPSDRCYHDLFHVSCAAAAVRGETEFGKEDVVRLVESVIAHRIDWNGAPTKGYRQALTQIAEWALSD